MSGRHPLDKLFGAKLERRAFPEEQGEYDEVRALIDLQNAAYAARGGLAHWAWWSLLAIPAALLIWWGADSDLDKSPTRAGTTVEAQVAPALQVNRADVAPAVKDPVERAANVEGAVSETATRITLGAVADRAIVEPMHRTSGTVPRSVNDRSDEAVIRSGSEAVVEGSVEQSSSFAGWKDDEATMVNGGLGYLSTIKTDASEWSTMLGAAAKAPIAGIINPDAYRKRTLGDIHFVGSVLRSDADGLATGPSSAFGIEYRVRARSLSLATGMHYGSYGLNGSGASGSNRVRLEYLQIPLLAGYEVGLRRFGLLVQGGVSCDLFFSASGRYGPLKENTAATIEDESFRTVNVQAILRPQVIYRASERIGLFAGPIWTRQLSSVAVGGPLAEARTTSTGASFGLIWTLERSTY